MVFDSLSHCAHYAALHPLFPAAFAYLQQFDPTTASGVYEIEGRRLYAVVERNRTAPAEVKAWESHRIYIDIQMVMSGRERMGYAPVENLTSAIAYSEVKDVEKYDATVLGHQFALDVVAGTFCIFFPQDGHKPGCMVESPEDVLKVVIKVRLRD